MSEEETRNTQAWSVIQSLLATLANIDLEYERETQRVARSATQASVKVHVLERLKQRHRERREPYVQQVALLEQRMRAPLS